MDETSNTPDSPSDTNGAGAIPDEDYGGYGGLQELDYARRQYELDMAGHVPIDPASDPTSAGNQSAGVPVAPGEAHQVTLKQRGPVCVRDHAGTPLAGASYVLVVNGSPIEAHTDEQGWIGPVPDDATEVELYVGHAAYRLALNAAEADALTTAQSILNALGYSAGPLDGQAGPRTKSAISYYQRDKKLAISGSADDATMSSLRAQHLLPG
jgi:hypothetical protein